MTTITRNTTAGLVGLIVNGILMPEWIATILQYIPAWGLALLMGILWQCPVIIVYKNNRFSVKYGWNML